MSAQIPTKKFPYLVINGSGDTVEEAGSPQGPKKLDVERRTHHPNPSNHGVRLLPFTNQSQGTHPSDFLPGLSFIPTGGGSVPSRANNNKTAGQNPNSSAVAYNLSKMKAILTAQNEMRKPASSLYPSGSQMSLIPETEEIYRKYFPVEESPSNDISAGGVSYRKGRDLRTGRQFALAPEEDHNNRSRKDAGTGTAAVPPTTVAAISSSSESNPSQQRPQKRTVAAAPPPPMPAIPDTAEERPTTSGSERKEPAGESLQPRPVTGRQVATKQYIKDVESKFKKKLQSQFMSLTGEIERQSTELTDLRKELRDLKQAARKSNSDQDGAKTQLDTLSRHVQDIDSKMDTLQESVTCQDKSMINKLIMFGDMAISDSESDDADESSTSAKYYDMIRTSSLAKMIGLSPISSSGIGKRASPSGISDTKLGTASIPSNAASSATVQDTFPKACSNWIPIAPDFDKLIHSIAILNYRMDRNQSMKLTTTKNGSNGTTAAFKHSDVIDLTIYKNGMSLGASGFRSYSTMSVIKFVNEIFNGYLPTELSTQYPDGVVIVLSDKRSIAHSHDHGFNGFGTKLVKQTDPPCPDLMPGRNINSLPKRTPIPSLQASTTASQVSVSMSSSTTECDILPDLIVGSGELRRSAKIVRLKINDSKNGKKYKLKVSVNSTIQGLADHLKKSFEEKEDIITNILTNGLEETARPKTYDIILPVPYGKLACLNSTLEDYGITHNTLLCVQEQGSPSLII